MARIAYEVDDGYVRSRPRYVEVSDVDLAECETAEERRDLITNLCREDFEQNVSWYVTDWGGVDV
jgi:hypothetical protein